MAEDAGDISHIDVARRSLAVVSIMLATIMQVLDTTIANVALPSMQNDLGASTDSINWVLTSYIVAAAIATPVTGWLADMFGRKELFMVSMVGFVVSSMACGMAWSLGSMVAFRLAQGVFGAALVPLSQTFLLDINPREKHGQAMALWGAGIMVGPIVGPTLGGYLTEYMNWRWVFFINVPVGILAFMGCLASLPSIPRRVRSLDIFGFAVLALGIGALQMMLDRGSEVDWFSAWEVWIETGLAVAGICIFATHILTDPDPFIDPHIFLDRNFVSGLLFIFVVGMVLLASIALLPPMLSRIFGYPTITTGLVMAPRGMGTMVSMIVVGRLVRLVDTRILVVAGLLLTSFSLEWMSGFSPQMDMWPVIESGVIQGFGLGLVFVPLSTIAFATLPARHRTDATALFSLVRNIGSSIGISVMTLLLTSNIQINHAELSQGISLFNPRFMSAVSQVGGMSTQSLAMLDGLVTRQALMISYVDDFRLMGLVTLAATVLVLFMRKSET